MKIVFVIARYLLGFLFAAAGLSGLLKFHPQPLPANPIGAQFVDAITRSHFDAFFFAVQLLGGLLLLSGFFVPIALILLAAELYNILAYHITLATGAAPGLVACVLWVVVFLQYRKSFEVVFAAKTLSPGVMITP
jgi:putative oxidoreductase